MAMTLITTNAHTGDSDDVSNFTSGIDGTYKLYIFKFIDMNPADDSKHFRFQGSIDSGSNYNVEITSVSFLGGHDEDDSPSTDLVNISTSLDQQSGTGAQIIASNVGNGADETCSGTLWLFNPSNTTYVKHFYAVSVANASGATLNNVYTAGYFNDTNDIDAIQFKFSSGNFNGTIKMYGVG